jgi:hypothetical protein
MPLPVLLTSAGSFQRAVVHHFLAPDSMSLDNELFLGILVMHEHHVGISMASNVECLARTQSNNPDLYAGSLLKGGKQMGEQTRMLSRGRRCHRDEALLCQTGLSKNAFGKNV